MIVTMLEARVKPEQQQALLDAYHDLGDPPPIVVESFLLSATDSDIWRLVTVFTSREDLEAMRESVRSSGQAPPGVRVFQAAGVEPTLTIFDVADRIATEAPHPG